MQARSGDPPRGSGALCAYVDILLEMHWYNRADPNDRRRRIQAYSRHTATPPQWVIELTPDGRDYLAHGDFQEDEFTVSWAVLRAVLEDATAKLTRQQIRQEWPADYPAPNDVMLWRWLERAVRAQLVCRDGSGRKHDPFCYWLPGQDEKWRRDPLVALRERSERDTRRWLTDFLGSEKPPDS
jgi:hypothetical protein